ncbi:MAG TPA: 16S rRNA (guanine(966)-N(2))-methyltransferase RsmD [Pyrinomonadaceae bacterium]|nr:16S rRNA (guanine(966)-N(2))-methyltransferase RsmD [Pyrinomonadaceae bacterium]
MHVLAGKYRGRFLQSSPSRRVRPTARRLREALFELLSFRVEGARFLDLCAGSGAVGIEALSRGASHVTFVDRSPRMCGFIESNLAACGVPGGQAEIWLSDAEHFLRRSLIQRDRVWDIAFFDPPYAVPYAPVLEAFGTAELLRPRGGVLVAEHHCDNPLPEQGGALKRWRTIRQGDSCLSFYERKN